MVLTHRSASLSPRAAAFAWEERPGENGRAAPRAFQATAWKKVSLGKALAGIKCAGATGNPADSRSGWTGVGAAITVARNMERTRKPAADGPESQRQRARSASASQKPAEAAILALQRSAGNGAVARALVQRAPQPVTRWEDCDEKIDELVEAWIKPKYEKYIVHMYSVNKRGEQVMNRPVLDKLKWWKRFADWGMVDVDVPFWRVKKATDEGVEPTDDNIEPGHVKVTVEAKGPTLTATLRDWYAPVETTLSWTGTLVGEKPYLFGDWSDCRIEEAGAPPTPPKPRSPDDVEKDMRREVPV